MATIKIDFDPTGSPEFPTLVLAKRSGERIGLLDNLSGQHITDNLNSYAELSFSITKFSNGEVTPYWDEIKNNRLIWCKEWDKWMALSYSLNEDDSTTKEIACKSLAESELSNVRIYDMEVNTESDIERDDYSPTVLFDDDPKVSLMHRLLKKVPTFQIGHVDSTLRKIQRSFSFNGTTIYDAFQQVAEEIQCLFIFDVKTGTDGRLIRTVSAYDLQRNCLDCGHRGDFDGDTCPVCGSSYIFESYGDDTGIFVSKEDLAESITFDTDTDSIKNCFKLTAGDDLMTATILNCNPNGSDSIWYLSPEMKEDMSAELQQKLSEYDDLYSYYQNDYSISLNENLVSEYNALVDKYRTFRDDLPKLNPQIVGYSDLLNALYDAIDFEGYLQSTLMPDAKLSDTSAGKELAKLTTSSLSPVAVQDLKIVSEATAKSAVLAMAKAIVDNRYQVKVASSSFTNKIWNGTFTVTNYSDDEDTATSTTAISVTINDDYETYVSQMVKKALAKGDTKDLSITGLFEKDLSDFKVELRKYCLDSLKAFDDACQGCLSVMIEQGTASEDNKTSDTYKKVYEPYYEKSLALAEEIKLRESEVQTISGKLDDLGGILSDGIETLLQKQKSKINIALNFESFLGEALWQEFTTYRMDDEYSNSNYVSDGLTNAEIFDRAREFISTAEKELKKAATATHTISTDLKNLLIIPEFNKIKEQFQVGNWIRIRIDDHVYKLKLISYSIDYENIGTIQVTFSDVSDVFTTTDALASTLANAQSMSKSYDSVKRQAEIGKKNATMTSGWLQTGLDATAVKYKNADNETIVMDSHGLLARSQNPITEEYSDQQAKLVSWGLAFTTDAWRTVQAAIGEFYFWNPKTQKMEQDYGVIADVLAGNLVLSESVGIFNQYNTITLDEDGFVITSNGDDDKTSVAFTIQRQSTDTDGNVILEKQLWINENGELEANLKSLKLQNKDILTTIGESTAETKSLISQTASDIRLEVSKEVQRLDGGIKSNTSLINQTAENITLDVEQKYSDLDGRVSNNTSSISLLPNSISLTVKENYIDPLTKRVSEAESSITQTADSITADISSKYSELDGKISDNASSISLLPDSITSSVKTSYIDPLVETVTDTKEELTEAEKRISQTEKDILTADTKITQTASSITADVSAKYKELDGKISKNTSSISLLPDSIASTVKTNYIDPLSNRISETEQDIENSNDRISQTERAIQETKTSITQTSSSITADVEVKYKELDGKISTNSSSINALPNSIKASIKEDYIDPLGERVTSAESSIKLNANNIESKVSKGNIISSINQSAESITISADKVNFNGSTTFTNAVNANQKVSNASTTAANAASSAKSANDTIDSWSYNKNRTLINGGNIAANTITAEQIAIGDFSNYATVTENDPSTLLSDQKIVYSAIMGDWIEKSDGTTGLQFLFVTQRFCINSFEVDDVLKFDFNVWSKVAQEVTYGVWFYDADKAYKTGNWDKVSVQAEGYFSHFSGTIKIPTLPNNIKYYRLGFQFAKYGTESRNCVQKAKVTKISGRLQVGDGFIDSSGKFQIGPMKSIGDDNEDVEFTKAIFVDYGIELLAKNDGETPYIDFHTEAGNYGVTEYDYTARIQNTTESWIDFYGLCKDGGTVPTACTLQAGQFRGTFAQASDRRLKKNIESLDESKAVENLMRYRPVSYQYINGVDSNIHHGLIAQEVQEIADWGLVDDRGEYLAINYIELIADLIKTTQYVLKEISEIKESTHTTTLSMEKK